MPIGVGDLVVVKVSISLSSGSYDGALGEVLEINWGFYKKCLLVFAGKCKESPHVFVLESDEIEVIDNIDHPFDVLC